MNSVIVPPILYKYSIVFAVPEPTTATELESGDEGDETASSLGENVGIQITESS